MNFDQQREAKRLKYLHYSRGYAAGRRNIWPDHTPPNPPAEQVMALFVAAKDLRDSAFGLLQVVIPDDGPDGVFTELEKSANAVDAAFIAISEWLKSPPVENNEDRRTPA